MKPLLLLFTFLLVLPVNSVEGDAQSHSPHSGIRCGTSELLQALAEMKEDPKGVLPAGLAQDISRRIMDRSIVSPQGLFRIHFDVSGSHAPPLLDRSGNGIPDHVDSVAVFMDDAWRIEVDECGFNPPPRDDFKPGIGGPDGLLDVYLVDLEGEFYGLAVPEVGAEIPPNRQSGYLIIDNDFDELDFGTRGLDGARVTTAHEFFHLVQFAGYRVDYSQSALYESTATFMEIKVHPSLSDYVKYVNVLQRAPQNYGFSTHKTGDITGYAHGSYIEYINQEAGKNVVRLIWEHFASNGASFTAINQALLDTESGLNLNNSFCDFARTLYLSGSRAPSPPILPQSETYEDLLPAATLTLPDDEPRVVKSSLIPLGFGVWRFLIDSDVSPTPDTLDLLLTNGRSNLGVGGRQWLNNPDEFTLTVSRNEISGSTPISFRGDTIHYTLGVPHNEFCVDPFFNGSSGTIVAAVPAPQPFINDGANQLLISVNLDPAEVESYEVNIYSVDMSLVAQLRGETLQTQGNLRGVLWNGSSDFGRLASSGVYLYTLKINDREPVLGKLAVVSP